MKGTAMRRPMREDGAGAGARNDPSAMLRRAGGGNAGAGWITATWT